MTRLRPVGMMAILMWSASTARAAGGDEGLNPLEFRGPHFLGFYAVGLVMVVIAAVMIRRGLRQPDGAPEDVLGEIGHGKFDPYDAAYLAGGKKLATGAAIAGLAQKGIVDVDSSTHKLTVKVYQGEKVHPLEKAIIDTIDGGKRFGEVVTAANDPLDEMESRLRETGLLMSKSSAINAQVLGAIPILALLVLGLWKISVGLERGRPVGALVFFCMLTGLIALFFAVKPIFRSLLGDRVLSKLRAEHVALKTSAGSRAVELAPTDLSLATALFGFGVLNHGPLSPIYQAMAPPTSGGSGCGGGTGCGGGGGGCGGGGCGGGGCGGCGGG